MSIFLRRLFLVLLIGLPILSLSVNAISWLRYGLDLPFFDDWRGYANGNIHSLSPSYLFTPVNDTLYPVGLALDALAQRYLEGNSIAYQFLSMVIVLGGLLLLQWRLLMLTLGDKWIAAASFVFTLLMLQPASYWGRENMAYHQALPVLFLMGALVLMFSPQARDRWRMPIVFALGLLAGVSYISGAFSVLAAGVALLGMGFLAAPSADRRTLLRGGLALTLAGASSSIAQFVMAILPNSGSTHLRGIAIALPNQPEFWYVFFGKVGRSLLLPRGLPGFSALVVALVCAAAIGVCVLFLVRRWKQQPMSPAVQRVAAVYIALAAVVFVYLLLVAAGRTNFRRPDVQSPTAVFLYGFERFHFFWATLLWPWLVAFGLTLAGDGAVRRQRLVKTITVILPLVAVVLMARGGAFQHKKQHRDEVSFRLPTISCLMTQLQRSGAIYCPEFNMADFTPAYMYARRIKASFVRHFPLLPLPLEADDPAPLFRLSSDAGGGHEWRDATRVSKEGLPLQAGFSPRLALRIGKPKEMANCLLLDVDVLIRAEQPDAAKLLYRPLGSAHGFTESTSRRVAYEGPTESAQRLSFQFESPTGFEDELRLDPLAKAQRFDISEVLVRCRLSNATARAK